MVLGSLVPVALLQPMMPGISMAASSMMQMKAELGSPGLCRSDEPATEIGSTDPSLTLAKPELEGSASQDHSGAGAPVSTSDTNTEFHMVLPRFPSDSEPGSPSPFRCVTDFDFTRIPRDAAADSTTLPLSSDETAQQQANLGCTQIEYVYVPVPVPVPVMQQHVQHAQEYQSQCGAEGECSQKQGAEEGRFEQWLW